MNEERVRQILQIEQQAAALYDAAVVEADGLPRAAEAQARSERDRILGEARAEAGRRREAARAERESAEILTGADGEIRRMQARAKENFERAVSFLVEQAAGTGAG